MAIRFIDKYAGSGATDAPISRSGAAGIGFDTVTLKVNYNNGTLTPLVDETTAQTLTNKTLTSPVLNGSALTTGLVSGAGATAALTAAQSGSTVLFDRAAGIIYTLPAPVVGLNYTFVVTTSITSNNAKIITDAGTTLLIGAVSNAVSAGTMTEFIANGTTHIACTQNGTTSGGLIGTLIHLYCVSATLWAVSGTILGSGTIITPFATS